MNNTKSKILAYANLNVKTNYSFLKSLIKIEDLIAFSKQNQLQHVCIMDTNVMYGVMPFYLQAKKENLNPIVGFELQNASYHCLLIALNYEGYKNLVKICSFNALKKNFVLEEYLKNIAVVDYLKNIKYDSSFYFTNDIQDKNYIACQEVRYLKAKDASVLELLDAINFARTISDDEILKTCLINKQEGNKYLFTPTEANTHFNETGLKNLDFLLNNVHLEIPFNEKYLMQFPIPAGYLNSKQYLHTLAINGLKQQRVDLKKSSIYWERLTYELKIIDQLGFNDYFLVVHEYVQWAKSHNIAVGPGRGSAVGSLVSYALGITSIDPLQYNLYFERFLNEARTTMPDIDIDFSDTRRQEVIDHLFQFYNNSETHQYRTSYLITFQTIKLRTALRDVGRVLNIDNKFIDTLCKKIPLVYDEKNPKLELSKIIDQTTYETYNLLFYYVLKIVGAFRQYSMHAAGIVLCNENLYNVIPIQIGNNNLVLTQYPMEYLENLGLLKMDILGLNNLTMLQDMLNFIHKQLNLQVDLTKIDLNYAPVFEMLTNGDTFGIFQFESIGMTSLLKRVKPTSIADLAMVSAMFRPGPQQQIDEWIQRRNHPELIKPIIAQLKGVLDETSGLLVYQEQVMLIAQIVAGFTLQQADSLRRAISKKHANELIALKKAFMLGCEKQNVSVAEANKVYDYIYEFASYGFNKSHAVAYAYLSYLLGYIKVKYPLQFLEGYLNSKSFKDNQKALLNFCLQHEIHLFAPNILNSTYGFNIDYKKQNLYFGFENIKGIGVTSIEKLTNLQKIAKQNLADIKMCLLKSISVVSKKMLETLVLSGCYDVICKDRNLSLKILSVLEQINTVLKGYDNVSDLKNLLDVKLQLSDFKNLDNNQLLNNEANLLGYIRKEIEQQQKPTAQEIWNNQEMKTFSHVTLINLQNKMDKKGRAYAALNLKLANEQVLFVTIPSWKYVKYLNQSNFFQINHLYKVKIKKSTNFLNVEEMERE